MTTKSAVERDALTLLKQLGRGDASVARFDDGWALLSAPKPDRSWAAVALAPPLLLYGIAFAIFVDPWYPSYWFFEYVLVPLVVISLIATPFLLAGVRQLTWRSALVVDSVGPRVLDVLPWRVRSRSVSPAELRYLHIIDGSVRPPSYLGLLSNGMDRGPFRCGAEEFGGRLDPSSVQRIRPELSLALGREVPIVSQPAPGGSRSLSGPMGILRRWLIWVPFVLVGSRLLMRLGNSRALGLASLGIGVFVCSALAAVALVKDARRRRTESKRAAAERS